MWYSTTVYSIQYCMIALLYPGTGTWTMYFPSYECPPTIPSIPSFSHELIPPSSQKLSGPPSAGDTFTLFACFFFAQVPFQRSF